MPKKAHERPSDCLWSTCSRRTHCQCWLQLWQRKDLDRKGPSPTWERSSRDSEETGPESSSQRSGRVQRSNLLQCQMSTLELGRTKLLSCLWSSNCPHSSYFANNSLPLWFFCFSLPLCTGCQVHIPFGSVYKLLGCKGPSSNLTKRKMQHAV